MLLLWLLLLWWVAISGVMLTALSHAWQIESRRQREMELVFRGEQIRLAIEAYVQVPVAEVAGEYAKAIQSARESAAQLEKIQQDYSRFVTFHNEHDAQRTKEVDGQLQWANKVDAQLEAANRWAMSLDEQLQRERAQRAQYERSLWFRIARRLFL